uniref:Uncharacterized protein n=1 Tax=Anguilla anguilla TaxID=7936 RepID=A0A0E9WDZ3_ANGAN
MDLMENSDTECTIYVLLIFFELLYFSILNFTVLEATNDSSIQLY